MRPSPVIITASLNPLARPEMLRLETRERDRARARARDAVASARRSD